MLLENAAYFGDASADDQNSRLDSRRGFADHLKTDLH